MLNVIVFLLLASMLAMNESSVLTSEVPVTQIVKSTDAHIASFKKTKGPASLATALTQLESYHIPRSETRSRSRELLSVAKEWLALIVVINKNIDSSWKPDQGAPMLRIPPRPADSKQKAAYDSWLADYNAKLKMYRLQDELRVLDRRATINFAALFVNEYFSQDAHMRTQLENLIRQSGLSSAKQTELDARFSHLSEPLN